MSKLKKEPSKFTVQVLKSLAYVRGTGLVNMFDKIGVISILSSEDELDVAEYLYSCDIKTYVNLLKESGKY